MKKQVLALVLLGIVAVVAITGLVLTASGAVTLVGPRVGLKGDISSASGDIVALDESGRVVGSGLVIDNHYHLGLWPGWNDGETLKIMVGVYNPVFPDQSNLQACTTLTVENVLANPVGPFFAVDIVC